MKLAPQASLAQTGSLPRQPRDTTTLPVWRVFRRPSGSPLSTCFGREFTGMSIPLRTRAPLRRKIIGTNPKIIECKYGNFIVEDIGRHRECGGWLTPLVWTLLFHPGGVICAINSAHADRGRDDAFTPAKNRPA